MGPRPARPAAREAAGAARRRPGGPQCPHLQRGPEQLVQLGPHALALGGSHRAGLAGCLRLSDGGGSEAAVAAAPGANRSASCAAEVAGGGEQPPRGPREAMHQTGAVHSGLGPKGSSVTAAELAQHMSGGAWCGVARGSARAPDGDAMGGGCGRGLGGMQGGRCSAAGSGRGAGRRGGDGPRAGSLAAQGRQALQRHTKPSTTCTTWHSRPIAIDLPPGAAASCRRSPGSRGSRACTRISCSPLSDRPSDRRPTTPHSTRQRTTTLQHTAPS
jgi:hypothetical protein